MTDKLDDPAGCTLAEAIECTVDTKLWKDWRDGREFLLDPFRRLSEINAGVGGNPPMSGEQRKEHERQNALAAAAMAALPELKKQFCSPLKIGKFMATGLFGGAVAERRNIDRDLWSQLDPFSQYEASIVFGLDNLQIYGVRISRAVVMQAVQPATAASEGAPRAEPATIIARMAARPGARRTPHANAVAAALKKNNFGSSPGDLGWKKIAGMIGVDMSPLPTTARELENLAKAVRRYYVKLVHDDPTGKVVAIEPRRRGNPQAAGVTKIGMK